MCVCRTVERSLLLPSLFWFHSGIVISGFNFELLPEPLLPPFFFGYIYECPKNDRPSCGRDVVELRRCSKDYFFLNNMLTI